MADRVEALVLQMSADLRKMEKAFTTAQAKANASATAIERRFDGMSSKVIGIGTRMGTGLSAAIAAIGVGAAIRETVQYADAWTEAANKLKAAGVAAGALGATQDRLVQISLQTRTGLSDTVDLYAKLLRSTDGVAKSQDDLFRATQIINESFKAGGANVQDQRAAILQLGQALGSGVLQGDELRSIRENAPLLAKAIAVEFGVTTAQLKKLGEQGKLTTDRIFQGILKAGQSIDGQFATTKATVSDAFANIGTVMTQFIGTLDQAVGSSSTFQKIMASVTKTIEGTTKAIQDQQSARPGQSLSGLALRIQSGLNDTIPSVGDFRRPLDDNGSSADSEAPKWIGETQKALVQLQRQQEKTGVAQKNRAESNLVALRQELGVYQAQITAQRDADLAQQKTTLEGFLEWRKLRDSISFAGRELASIGIFYDALDRQILRIQRSDPKVFLDDVADGAAKVSRAFDDANFNAYSTDLEKTTKQLSEMSAAQRDLTIAIAEAQTKADQAANNDDGSKSALQRINDANKALGDLKKKAVDLNLSRAAVQTLLDYAKATDDVAGALQRIPALSSILDPNDATLVRNELIKMAQDGVDAAATGADKIEVDFRKAMEKTQAAHKSAVAAGIDDLDQYGREVDELFQKRADDLQEFANQNAFKSPFKGLADDLKDDPKHLPEVEVYGEALRNATKQGLSRGLKEGIETDDWGHALRDVFADSLTQALDKSLDRLADFLTNLAIGDGSSKNSGIIGDIINGIGSYFGGNRAGGGGVSAGATYKINETGGSEYLRLGKTGGEILTAKQMNQRLGGGWGGGTTINAPFIVQGSITEEVWPKVQAELNKRDIQWAQRIPYMVDARVIDSKRHRRYK